MYAELWRRNKCFGRTINAPIAFLEKRNNIQHEAIILKLETLPPRKGKGIKNNTKEVLAMFDQNVIICVVDVTSFVVAVN